MSSAQLTGSTRNSTARGTVAVVIVNWNSGDRLSQCVRAVGESRMPPGTAIRQVVVVDNASTDESVVSAVEALPSLSLIQNLSNRGFAAACNQGADHTDAEFLLFLNPDTRPQRDTVGATVAFLGSPQGSGVGICGVRLVDDALETGICGARFPSLRALVGDVLRLNRVAPRAFPPHLLTATECERGGPIDQVTGAFFVIRRSLFSQLGGFDERFFMYYEEVDLSYRASLLGWTSWLLPDALCYHEGGASSRTVPANRLLYNLRSRLQFAHKHFSIAHLACVAVVTLLLEPPLRLSRGLASGSPGAVRNTLSGYGALLGWLARSLLSYHDAGRAHSGSSRSSQS